MHRVSMMAGDELKSVGRWAGYEAVYENVHQCGVCEECMKLICLMPARNEDWIIGLSARAALMWCDELIVMDHASTDRT